MLTEKKLDLAAQMYRIRKTVIGLIGLEKFRAKVAVIRPQIEDLAKKYDGDVLKAGMDILDAMQRLSLKL